MTFEQRVPQAFMISRPCAEVVRLSPHNGADLTNVEEVRPPALSFESPRELVEFWNSELAMSVLESSPLSISGQRLLRGIADEITGRPQTAPIPSPRSIDAWKMLAELPLEVPGWLDEATRATTAEKGVGGYRRLRLERNVATAGLRVVADDAPGPEAWANARLSPVLSLFETVDDAEQLQLDRDFVERLAAERTVAGSVAPFHGIKISYLSQSKAKLSVSIPEHIAETPSGSYVHWPATEASRRVAIDGSGRFPVRGDIVNRLWCSDPAWLRHPLRGDGDVMCFGETLQRRALELSARGLHPARIVAEQLVAARFTIVYGVDSEANVFQPYERAFEMQPSGMKWLGGRDEALEVQKARNIELVDWK